jgi:hypothetical protein
MKPIVCCLLALLPFTYTNAQKGAPPGQTVKGMLTDVQSNQPLSGVTIVITSITPVVGTATSDNGRFSFSGIPVGRHTLKATIMGYEPVIISNFEVTSGKEVDLDIRLKENVQKLNTVVISANNKNNPINELAQVSARQMNIEEATRYAGTRNDPARMAQNFAGVSGSNDASNDIIIRGNSPFGMLWRMDGIDIPNPNHFSGLSATGGPVTMLNMNTLKNSDFLTSAFPATYGNALAGVFDLRLRNGNRDKYEYLAQVGFNGFEAAAEGPISKKNGSSFMIDYRYSLIAIVQALGASVGTGSNIPKYQDLNFKVDLPTKHGGTFSIFGLGGISSINFKAEDNNEDVLYGNNDRDRTYSSKTGVVGLSHTYAYNSSTYGRAFAAFSLSQNTADEKIISENKPPQQAVELNFKQQKYNAGYLLNKKFSARNQLTTIVSADLQQLSLHQQFIKKGEEQMSEIVNTDKSAMLYKGSVNWQHFFNDDITMNTGVYAQYFGLNSSYAIEPRWNMKFQLNNANALSFGAGMHSQLQPLEVYFYQAHDANNQPYLPNQSLDFTRSIHTVLGYDAQLASKLRLKLETYYQHLYDAPVEIMPSSFSMLNTGSVYGYSERGNLINKGTGRNYGVELTLEQFLDKGFYFLFTQTVFNSEYKGSDQIWRSTAFNAQYVTNFLIGKEWAINEAFSVGADSKLAYAGGQRYTAYDIPATMEKGYVVYLEKDAFAERNPAYFRWDLKLSFKWDQPKMTQKFFVDLQNLTFRKNLYTKDIDPKTGVVKNVNQLSFFPNFNYQITF